MTMKIRIVAAIICTISIMATIGILSHPFSSPTKKVGSAEQLIENVQEVKSSTQVGMYAGPHTVITSVGTEWFAPVLTGLTRLGNIHPLTPVIWQRRINGDDAQVRDMGPGINEKITNVMFSLEWRVKPGQQITSCKFAHDEIPIRN